MWNWFRRSKAEISSEERAARYQSLNSTFERTLVFRFGDDAGFFSELNNMALAVLYCLDNKIKFVLYTSGDLRIGLREGWNDYFRPFCEQVSDEFHRVHNERFRTSALDPALSTTRRDIKRAHGFDYYTYELWESFRSPTILKRRYAIRELEINDGFHGAMRKVLLMLWRFSDKVQSRLLRATHDLALPHDYLGLHVRGGDKVVEARVHPSSAYMDKVPTRVSRRTIFLLTDDHRILQELVAGYPESTFLTLCREEERGFHYEKFIALGKQEQFDEYVKLLVSMEVLRKAKLIVGSFTSNPGMFLGLIVEPGQFIGVDSKRWLLTW